MKSKKLILTKEIERINYGSYFDISLESLFEKLQNYRELYDNVNIILESETSYSYGDSFIESTIVFCYKAEETDEEYKERLQKEKEQKKQREEEDKQRVIKQIEWFNNQYPGKKLELNG